MQWNLPEKRLGDSVVDHLLKKRKIPKSAQKKFLNPTHKSIHLATDLYDTKKAAIEIKKAIKAGKKIGIHGDYDVDGVASTALLWRFLYRKAKADVVPFIPSRFDDGYGLSKQSLDKLQAMGVQLLITVDCGIKNEELIREYAKKGLQVIITDHHTLDVDSKGNSISPESALAVVHPQHPDGNYPYIEICGTTVAWKLVQVLAKEMDISLGENEYLDLVSLATVCDLMPLVDENRAIVSLGVKQSKKTNIAGIRALAEVAGVEVSSIDTYHYGFVLGPRINAAGRLESAMIALRLLSTDSEHTALELARDVSRINTQRQNITMEMVKTAEAMMDDRGTDDKLIFIYGDEWPEGILGLIAGRLSERYYRPVIAGSLKDGQLVASARSPKGFHLAKALEKQSHLLEKFGGHEQAAGLTVKEEKLQELIDALTEYANKEIKEDSLKRVLDIDVVLESQDLTLQTAGEIESLAPFGFGNITPVGAILGAEVVSKKLIGKDKTHISVNIFAGDTEVRLIHFNAVDKWANIEEGDEVDIAGMLEVNEWKGRKNLQMRVRDVRSI